MEILFYYNIQLTKGRLSCEDRKTEENGKGIDLHEKEKKMSSNDLGVYLATEDKNN